MPDAPHPDASRPDASRPDPVDGATAGGPLEEATDVEGATTDEPTEEATDVDASPSRSGSPRRSWPQRLTIAGVIVTAFASFAAAGTLAAGQWVVSSRNLVLLDERPTAEPVGNGNGPSVVVPELGGGADEGNDPPETTEPPPATFPDIEPDAKNFLITGADGNACIDPDSPFAGGFGDAHQLGDRSDTIMVWRVNPATRQLAILSFPRDLYVQVEGAGRARINTAYRRDDPERLRATLARNFGIDIDHYIQVDFCAFKRLVDAVGGVEVPFEFPARDSRTGLDVPTVGCFNFSGEHALAYVRSRRYQYEDPPGSGNWRTDGTSDLGRIARQQDFLRRTVATVLSRGLYTPSVVGALIETNREYLTVDSELTVSRMLQFAGVLQSLDPNDIGSYQIEAVPQTVAGNSVLVPRLEGSNMRAILAVFRGEALIADAPEQDLDTTTTTTLSRPGGVDDTSPDGDPATTDDTDAVGETDDGDSGPPSATTTLPEVTAEENLLGVAPPRDVTCP